MNKKEINSLLEEIDSKYKSLEKELYNHKVSEDFNAKVCVGMVVLTIRKDIKKLKKLLRKVNMENKLEDTIKKQHQEDFIDLDAACYYSNIPLSELCSPEQILTKNSLKVAGVLTKKTRYIVRDIGNETVYILGDKRKSRNKISKISKRKNRR